MRPTSFSRLLDGLKSCHIVVSVFPVVSKRTFHVLYRNCLQRYVQFRYFGNNVSSKLLGNSVTSIEGTNDWKRHVFSVPVVKAFTFVADDGSSKNHIAVYWNDRSKYNRFKDYPCKTKTNAEIGAVCLALKQAIFNMYLPRVRVITNSKFVCKHFGNTSLCWNLDEFMRRKWMFFMFSATEAADLYRLLHMIDATLEYSSSIDETVKIFYENVSGKMPFGNITAGLSASDISVVASPVKDLTIQKQGKPEKGSVAQGLSVGSSTTNSISKSTPVVYTCGVLHSKVVNEKKYVEAGIGVYWPYCHEMGTGKRYTFYPITLVRCQLQAIIEALQQAIDQNYSSIILRTDCTSFLVHHSRQWIKTNGSYVRYHDQYLRIVDLCKNIKVKFLSASDRAAMSEAETLAENGICLPLPAKKSRKYSNPINVNFSDKRDV